MTLNPFHVHHYEAVPVAMGDCWDICLACHCGDRCHSLASALRMTERSKERAANRIAWSAVGAGAVVLALAVLL